eukprot:TRINITY_DN111914_c0_g1_i1.p1 TRINITY_DN111914_c0_g1~~TRINITY_DN111914_c0_g1_i1.p1  ORF type:complete len:438 (-),score=68.60 TRINITY_DN111914_c0_g1_i1:48-1307(-)
MRMHSALLPDLATSTVKVRINRLTSEGYGLGRLSQPRHTVVVFGGLPGELVEVQLFRRLHRFHQGRLLRVLEPSSSRITPECELFGRCGGCQLQHLAYSEQLRWKRRQVEEELFGITGLGAQSGLVADTVPSPQEYGYRTKISPHLQMPPATEFSEKRSQSSWVQRAKSRAGPEKWKSLAKGPLGYLEEVAEQKDANGTWWKQVVDMSSCAVATDCINAALPATRAHVRKHGGPFKVLLRHTSIDGVVFDRKAVVREVVPGFGEFSFKAGGFFQTNSSILPALVTHVMQAAKGTEAKMLVDAYCGVGLFAIACSSLFDHVHGIELNADAVEMAIANAKQHGITNTTFQVASSESGLKQLPAAARNEGLVVIVDPPRQGLGEAAQLALLAAEPVRIIYVSCSAASLALQSANVPTPVSLW